MDKNRRMNPVRRVAVIGAGFSGMVSSLLLSLSGKEVVLIERDANVGPLLRNRTYDGVEFNNAFHYIGGYYPGSALHASFEQLGLNDDLTAVPLNEKGLDCFLGVTDGALFIPVDSRKVKSVLADAFPGNESVLSEYFEVMQEVFEKFSFYSLREFFSKTAAGMIGISLSDFLAKRKASRRLIEFLSVYSEIILGVSAQEVPFINHLLGVGAYFISAHTFEGGGGALVAALEHKMREAGIQVLTGREVVRINCNSEKKYTGLRIKSGKKGQNSTIETDSCISTVHPRRLLQLLPGGLPSENYRRRISTYRSTKSVWMFHLALDTGTMSPYPQNCHLLSWKGDGTLDHLFTLLPSITVREGKTNEKQGLSVLMKAWDNDSDAGCPGREKKSLSKADDSIDEVCRQKAPEFLDGIRYNMISKLEKFFPELSGKYRIVRTLSPCDFDRLNRSWRGAVYGVKCSVDRHDFTSFGPLTRLYLSGQSVVAPGIFGSLISSYLAVERLLR